MKKTMKFFDLAAYLPKLEISPELYIFHCLYGINVASDGRL